ELRNRRKNHRWQYSEEVTLTVGTALSVIGLLPTNIGGCGCCCSMISFVSFFISLAFLLSEIDRFLLYLHLSRRFSALQL
ncbi:hypothetical protein M569_10258, partial [Genlisea aurea]